MRRPHRVADLTGVGEDGGGVLGHGQLHAVAIGYRTAPRRDRDLLHLLRRGLPAQVVPAHADDPEGPRPGEEEKPQEQPEQQPDPPFEQNH